MLKRQSNFELLRILSMFFIVSFHCVFHSGVTYSEFSTNVFFVKSFYLLGELGVNLFMLISGYFMINSHFKLDKLVLLFSEITFYIFLSNILYLVFTHQFEFYFPLFVNIVYSTIYDVLYQTRYWFFRSYIFIYIFSNFINKYLKMLSKHEYKKFIFLFFIIWSLLPTILGFGNGGNTETLYNFNRFLWLFYIYCIGAYIRLYNFSVKLSKIYLFGWISLITMLIGIIVIENYKGFFEKFHLTESAYFWQPNTVPMLILSISVFSFFKSKNIPYKKIINTLSSTMFGIYLLTDGLLQKIIWINIFSVKEHLQFSFYYSVSFVILCSLLLMFIGIVVDFIRQFIEKYTVKKFLTSQIYINILNKLRYLFSKII